MIRLVALGAPRLAAADGRPIALPSQTTKRLALLAYLAIARPRGAHGRDALRALLWPELDQARACTALRQALHGLRRVLGADVLAAPGAPTVALHPGAIACDVWELEAAAARGDRERVLALHHGELLAGLFVPDSAAFERWLDEERARVRALALDAAWGLAERARVADEARRWVRRAIALTPSDEGTVRRGMRLLAEGGDRAGALTVYERFAAGLREALDAEPSAETAAEYRRYAGRMLDRVTRVTGPG